MDEVPSHDIKILKGDFNAQIGPDRNVWEAHGERSDNGETPVFLLICIKFNTNCSMHFSRPFIRFFDSDDRSIRSIDSSIIFSVLSGTVTLDYIFYAHVMRTLVFVNKACYRAT